MRVNCCAQKNRKKRKKAKNSAKSFICQSAKWRRSDHLGGRSRTSKLAPRRSLDFDDANNIKTQSKHGRELLLTTPETLPGFNL